MKAFNLSTLALTATMLLASAASAQNVTISNGNGGEVSSNSDCIRADGQAK